MAAEGIVGDTVTAPTLDNSNLTKAKNMKAQTLFSLASLLDVPALALGDPGLRVAHLGQRRRLAK